MALSSLVAHYTSIHLFDSAIFLGERLLCESPTDASRLLLATAYAASGSPRQAVTVLTPSRARANRYLLARLLLEVGHALEAEEAVLRGSTIAGAFAGATLPRGEALRRALRSEVSRGTIAGDAAGVYVLGCAELRLGRRDAATECFSVALSLDPFNWAAFDALAKIGVAPEPNTAFAVNAVAIRNHPAWAAAAPPPLPSLPHTASGSAVGTAATSAADAPVTPAVRLVSAVFSQSGAASTTAPRVPRGASSGVGVGGGGVPRGAGGAPASAIGMGVCADISTASAVSSFTGIVSSTTPLPGGGEESPLMPATPAAGMAGTRARPPLFASGASGAPFFSVGGAPQFSAPRFSISGDSGMLTDASPAGSADGGGALANDGSTIEGSASLHFLGTPAADAIGTTVSGSDTRRAVGTEGGGGGYAHGAASHSNAAATTSGIAARVARLTFTTPGGASVGVGGGGVAAALSFSVAAGGSSSAMDAFTTPVNGPSAGAMSVPPSSAPPPPPPLSALPTGAGAKGTLKRTHATAVVIDGVSSCGGGAGEVAGSGENAAFPTKGRGWEEGATEVLHLLSACARVTRALSLLKCRDAEEAVARLPSRQRDSGWAQCALGRALFESATYARAATAFRAALASAPWRLDGLDVYSSVLWQLRATADAAALAAATHDYAPTSPTTWIVIGNAFSVGGDGARARAAFRRAIGLAPTNALAHALAGHEALAEADLDAAASAFRESLALDPRAYASLYGLGTVAFRRGAKEDAVAHYAAAAALHPGSSILACYKGMALAAVGRHAEALTALAAANAIDPGNPQAAYQRAQVYSAQGAWGAAYKELFTVLEKSPREPAILVQAGRIAKRLGRIDEATRFLTTALEALTAPAGILGGAIATGPGATAAAAAAAAGSDRERNAVNLLLASLAGGGEGEGLSGLVV